MQNQSNPFEAAGRARKVHVLIMALVGGALASGDDPHSREFVNRLGLASQEFWRAIAAIAGINPPSEETQADVIAFFANVAMQRESVAAGMH